MSLAEFASVDREREATITVLDRESTRPVYRLLTRLFGDDAVTVQEATTGDSAVPSDTVLLEKTGDDVGMAVSSLGAVRDELLLVNSDIYVTGARELEAVQTPDVVAELDELPFTVTGDPEHRKEKLLLIEMSRHIEAMAWQAGEGRLATGFQSLSRLERERGTRRVYARLGAETDVDTHVYGAPDADPSVPGVTIHGVDDDEISRAWFVVYDSGEHADEAAGLVAVEREPRTWEGCWTYDADRVRAVLDYLERTYE